MTSSTEEPRRRGWRHALPPLAAYLALAVVNARIIPWFELPDEKHHLHYAQALARERKLPDLRRVTQTDSEGSVCAGFNPPLYYVLGACLVPPDAPYLSPRLAWHPGGAKGYSQPPQGGWEAYRAILDRLWLLRGMSILFGTLTVLACFAAGRELAGEGSILAIGMAWFPVALPQFVSMSAAINNEGAATAMMAIAVAVAARAASKASWDAAAVAGLFLALSLLSKVSGLALVPALALALLPPSAAGKKRWGIPLVAMALAVALLSPWLAHNYEETGDLLASSAMRAAAVSSGVGAFPHTVGGIVRGLGLLFCSFYACYGQLAVWLPVGVYFLPLGVALLAALGWLRGRDALAEPDRRMARAAVVAVLCILGAWLAYNLKVYSPQGRYLFVAMPYLSFLVVRGLQRRLPPRLGAGVVHAACAAIAALQVFYLFVWVRDAYAA